MNEDNNIIILVEIILSQKTNKILPTKYKIDHFTPTQHDQFDFY